MKFPKKSKTNTLAIVGGVLLLVAIIVLVVVFASGSSEKEDDDEIVVEEPVEEEPVEEEPVEEGPTSFNEAMGLVFRQERVNNFSTATVCTMLDEVILAMEQFNVPRDDSNLVELRFERYIQAVADNCIYSSSTPQYSTEEPETTDETDPTPEPDTEGLTPEEEESLFQLSVGLTFDNTMSKIGNLTKDDVCGMIASIRRLGNKHNIHSSVVGDEIETRTQNLMKNLVRHCKPSPAGLILKQAGGNWSWVILLIVVILTILYFRNSTPKPLKRFLKRFRY